MILKNKPIALLAQDQSFNRVKGLVAKVLLETATNSKPRRRCLAQRDIARITGTGWGIVHMSLKSLQDEGVIRIERNRLIINKDLIKNRLRS